MISVAIIEDNADIRQRFAYILDSSGSCVCTGAYENAEEALSELLSHPPDVVLMDIDLSGMSGIECASRLKSKLPSLDILMITVHTGDKYVFDALRAGACGYLNKNTSPARLLDAIEEVRQGGAPMSSQVARIVVDSFSQVPKDSPELTRREFEVLEQLCQGKSYKMIADTLCVSEDTVRFHIKKIYRKLQVNSKSEAVIKALKEKIV